MGDLKAQGPIPFPIIYGRIENGARTACRISDRTLLKWSAAGAFERPLVLKINREEKESGERVRTLPLLLFK